MRKFVILIIVLIFSIVLYGKSVPSSCDAPDSIRALFSGDSERLTFRKIFRQGLDYKDSIVLPQIHLDTVMNAFLAVYNAVSLPERDTVISILNIHSTEPLLNSFFVHYFTEIEWIKNVKKNIFPTENSFVDSLINTFHFKGKSFFGDLLFKSDYNYNIQAVINSFKNVPGAWLVESNHLIGDGDEITDSVYTDFVELVYSHGWGDCPNGCVYRRYWKFRVYHDCSVEFVESYGNTLDLTDIKIKQEETVSFFPNPFSNFVSVKGINQEFDYTITNLLGQRICSGKSEGLISLENSELLTGNVYFLTFQTNYQIWNFKLLKE